MFGDVTLFDCTFREVGYQTGWFFDPEFCRDYYKFAQGAGIDYLELGFFHNVKADPGRGSFRYCSTESDKVAEVFRATKNTVKLSAMRDIQRPLAPLHRREEGIVDAIRILTRSYETKMDILEKHVDEVRDKGFEVFINFTSSGRNTSEMNKAFACFAARVGVPVIYFADTESVFSESYIQEVLELCRAEGVEAGIHLHDKNGTAERLLDVALANGCRWADITLLGLGGKWHDGNVSVEHVLRMFKYNPGYEMTRLKTGLIQQLIKYNGHSAAVL